MDSADINLAPATPVQDFTGAELAELCDISRLPRKLKAKMSHRAELLPPVDKNAATIEKQRTLYAALGQKSGESIRPPPVRFNYHAAELES